MGITSRRKGVRVELEILHQLQDAGLIAEKLSYAWKQTHDIKLMLFKRERKLEIKCRARGFQMLYKWLKPVDLLIVKADRSEPLVVMSMATLIELIKRKT